MRRVDEANTEARRKHVMLAAMRCFAQFGLQNTSVQNICREAKMTPGHLYYYFSNKNEIVESLFEIGTSELMDRIEHMLDGDDIGDSILRVHHEAESMRLEWDMSPGLRLEFFAEAARNESLRSTQKQLNERLMTALDTAVARAVAAGRLDPDVDRADLAHAIFLLWTGLGNLRADSTLDIEKFERAVTMLIKPWLRTGAKRKAKAAENA